MKLTMKGALCALGLTATMSVHADHLTFGIVPQQSATKLASLWTPILSYLSTKSGVELSFATAPDIPTFEKRVLDGEYELLVRQADSNVIKQTALWCFHDSIEAAFLLAKQDQLFG